MSECGTHSGLQAHHRRYEVPCEECKAAHRDYMREYRATHPDVRAKERSMNAARARALTRLGRKYPAEYRQLWLEELAKDPQ